MLANRYTLNESSVPVCCVTLIVEGDLSAYGLVNAVTHFSQGVEDYDRATEFEALGGKVDRSARQRVERACGSGMNTAPGSQDPGWCPITACQGCFSIGAAKSPRRFFARRGCSGQ